MFSGRIVGNNDGCSASGNGLTKGARIVTLIAKEDFAQRRCREQVGRGRDVRDVACAEPKDAQPPYTIADRVDLSGAAAARAADRLRRRPPFPPAAERCAFTAELSIMATSAGPASASA
jgi:hypothetical protein